MTNICAFWASLVEDLKHVTPWSRESCRKVWLESIDSQSHRSKWNWRVLLHCWRWWCGSQIYFVARIDAKNRSVFRVQMQQSLECCRNFGSFGWENSMSLSKRLTVFIDQVPATTVQVAARSKRSDKITTNWEELKISFFRFLRWELGLKELFSLKL